MSPNRQKAMKFRFAAFSINSMPIRTMIGVAPRQSAAERDRIAKQKRGSSIQGYDVG